MRNDTRYARASRCGEWIRCAGTTGSVGTDNSWAGTELVAWAVVTGIPIGLSLPGIRFQISAPVTAVFAAVSDIGNLPQTNPAIVHVEFISETRSGIGTRFIETRLMNGKENKTELEVTEYEKDKCTRMISDTHGTVWDTLFTVTPAGDNTELELVMDCRAHKLLPKLLNPLMKGLFRKGLQKHVDAVKQYCEGIG